MKADTEPGKAVLESPKVEGGGVSGKYVQTAVLSSFLFGFQTVVMMSINALIAVKFQWCDNDWQSDCGTATTYISLVNSSVYLGAAFGALIFGKVVMYGSRKQLIASDALFALGGLCQSCAQGVTALVAGRIISGVGLGLCGIAAPVYIAEISPRERRGINSGQHGIYITLGILAGSCMGIPQDPAPTGPGETLQGLNVWYWRFMLGFQMLPALVQLYLFLLPFAVDPPSFLVQNGRIPEARALLYKIYGLDVDSTSTLATPLKQSGPNAALDQQINELIEASEAAKEVPFIHVHQAIFDPFLRCAVFIGLGLAAFQQASGINALMAFSIQFFIEGGIPADKTVLASTGMCTANVIISYFSSLLVDVWGRRKLLLTGSFGQAFAMGVLSICVLPSVSSSFPPVVLGLITLTAFTLFVTTFSLGLGAVTWLYLSEIYPMEIRGAALSACGVLNWLCSFGIVFVAGFLSLPQTCTLLFCISAAGFLGVYRWIVETKGTSMDDSPLTPRSEREKSTLLTPRSKAKAEAFAGGVKKEVDGLTAALKKAQEQNRA